MPRTASGEYVMRKNFIIMTALAFCGFAASYTLVKLGSAGNTRPPELIAGMVWIPGGEFTMGCDANYASPAEGPAHRVRLDGFWIDETDVANAQFRAFVEDTGYVTTAERRPTLEEIMSQAPPGALPPKKEDLVPGSIVFTPPNNPVSLDDVSQWQRWTPGANWRHPE